MPKPIYIPRLSKKLDLLLRHDTAITSRTILARELGIQPPQISKRQTGRDYGLPDMVPRQHVERMIGLFNVTREWMDADRTEGEAEDQFLVRLEAAVRGRVLRSDWEALFLEADISDRLAIKRPPEQRWQTGSLRGLRREDAARDFNGDCFATDERVYIELRTPEWATSESGAIAHVLLVLVDQSSQIECICPSRAQGLCEHRITAALATFPNDLSGRLFQITAPAGIQTLFAIVSREPLSDGLYTEVSRPDHPNLRDCLARLIPELRGRERSAWECLKYHYFVVDNDERPDSE